PDANRGLVSPFLKPGDAPRTARGTVQNHKKSVRQIGLTLVLLAIGAGSGAHVARAANPRFIICLPGGPGDPQSAKSFLPAFGEALAPLIGQSKVEGDYTTDRGTCARALNSDPLFAMVPAAIYLSDARKAKLQPVAQVISPEMGGDSPRFFVMTSAAQIT